MQGTKGMFSTEAAICVLALGSLIDSNIELDAEKLSKLELVLDDIKLRYIVNNARADEVLDFIINSFEGL